MTVTVISAIFGDYDTVKRPVRQSVDCRWVMVADSNIEAPGWEVCRTLVPDDRHPRLAAKEPKLRPWDYAEDGPWIWIDGSFEVTSSTFVAEALAATDGRTIGQWSHPWRNCLYEEALEVNRLRVGKYKDYPALEQAEHYRRTGHPVNWGLWATGLIVYRERTDYLADLWWAEMNAWGYQDQVSQPVALRSAGLRPVSLPGGLHRSPWLRWHPHRSEM